MAEAIPPIPSNLPKICFMGANVVGRHRIPRRGRLLCAFQRSGEINTINMVQIR